MLEAYVDDSANGDPNLFVLAGFVSSADRWLSFSKAWQKLIDHRSEHYRKLDYFKMEEMSSARDRERCAWFHKVIEDHAVAAVSLTISTHELRRQVDRMFDDPMMRKGLGNPWHFAVSAIIRDYAINRPNITLPAGPVNFIFDQALNERRLVWNAWDAFLGANPQYAPLMGSMPRFEDDKEVLPLQAADMFAWWVRHWQLDGLKEGAIYQCQFPWPRNRSDMPWTHIHIGRSEIRRRLREIRAAKHGFVAGTVPPKQWLR
jgi:hypothetical protein